MAYPCHSNSTLRFVTLQSFLRLAESSNQKLSSIENILLHWRNSAFLPCAAGAIEPQLLVDQDSNSKQSLKFALCVLDSGRKPLQEHMLHTFPGDAASMFHSVLDFVRFSASFCSSNILTSGSVLMFKQQKVVLKLLVMADDKTKQKAIEAVADIYGVDSIAADSKEKKITVIGEMDTVKIAKKLKKIGKVDIVSVGPAKEEKKEENTK